jgi:Holliday junction resolvase RusA-like endonuclease
MIPPITIVLRGAPVPYRHRTAPTMHRYLPKKQRDQLAMLRHEAQEAMNGRNPLDTPVSIELQVEVPIPRSWSRKKQNSAAAGELLPGSRPDLSNMLKLAEDVYRRCVSRRCFDCRAGNTETLFGVAGHHIDNYPIVNGRRHRMARLWRTPAGRPIWWLTTCEETAFIADYLEVAGFIEARYSWKAEFEDGYFHKPEGLGQKIIDNINTVRKRRGLEPIVITETDADDYARDIQLDKPAHRSRLRDELSTMTPEYRQKLVNECRVKIQLLQPPHKRSTNFERNTDSPGV